MLVKWDMVDLKCAACGGAMEPVNGPWGVFYQCSNAYKNEPNEPPCANRMNAEMYDNILDKLTDLLVEAGEVDLMNYTGFKWSFRTSYQHFRFRIQKHTQSRIVVQVCNMKKCLCNF